MYPTTCSQDRIDGTRQLELKGTVPGGNFGSGHGGTENEP